MDGHIEDDAVGRGGISLGQLLSIGLDGDVLVFKWVSLGVGILLPLFEQTFIVGGIGVKGAEASSLKGLLDQIFALCNVVMNSLVDSWKFFLDQTPVELLTTANMRTSRG